MHRTISPEYAQAFQSNTCHHRFQTTQCTEINPCVTLPQTKIPKLMISAQDHCLNLLDVDKPFPRFTEQYLGLSIQPGTVKYRFRTYLYNTNANPLSPMDYLYRTVPISSSPLQ